MEITGKRVLITGANRGLGRALVIACAKAGAREIVAGARQPEKLAELKADLAASSVLLTPVQLDVTSDDEAQAAAALGCVEILINNAGVATFGGVFKASPEEMRREIEVNYFGTLRMARAFAPALIEQGDGLIVNVASITGKVNLPMFGTYSATKAALLSLGQAMRADLSPHGVRVITVLPGTIDTDMARGYDGLKMPVEQAAAEIIEAIRREDTETAIGDEARGVMAGLAADPQGIERAFAQYRA